MILKIPLLSYKLLDNSEQARGLQPASQVDPPNNRRLFSTHKWNFCTGEKYLSLETDSTEVNPIISEAVHTKVQGQIRK